MFTFYHHSFQLLNLTTGNPQYGLSINYHSLAIVQTYNNLEKVTYNSSSKLQLSHQSCSHMITIQVVGNLLEFITVAASCNHMIVICHLPSWPPTSKVNLEKMDLLNNCLIHLMTMVICLTTVLNCHKIRSSHVMTNFTLH